MAAVARGNGQDLVSGGPITTNESSSKVFSDGYGIVREGDLDSNLNPLISASSKVFIEGKGAGRVGDSFALDGPISGPGSSKVFIGG